MSEQNDNSMNRRRFLSLSATAGAGVLTAATLVEPAHAGGLILPQDTPSKGSTPAMITPKWKTTPEKLRNTAAAGISGKTHDEHFKLYLGYVKKVNDIRTALGALGVPDPTKANATFSDIRELKVEYSFALGGVKNHELYFGHLGGKGGDPDGPIGDAIKAAFGSFANWKADLKSTAIAARGWVWLAHDYTDGSLFNYIGDSQNAFPVWNATPILGLDVYEHAYWFDFQSARASYIDAFFKVIDWDAVNANLKLAQSIAAAAK